MAEKENIEELDSDSPDMDELDDLGLDDLDFDDDGLGNRTPSAREVSKDLAEEAGKGFLESLVKKTAEKSLPEEYSNNYHTAMDYVDHTREIYGKSKSKIQRSLYGLGKEVKKILPFQSKMLENFISRYEEDNQRAKEISEEAMRESAIAGSISDIFDKQLEVQKALQARQDAKDEVDTKRDMVTTKLHTDILTSIDSNLAQKTAFSLQIGKEYYKKSLELQYKTYYIQADMLKTTKDYYKGFSEQFDNVVKNTGLPDFVKLTDSERARELIRDKSVEYLHDKFWSNNKYIERVKQRVDSYISSKVSDVTDKIDQARDAVGGITAVSESPAEAAMMMGQIFASLGGGTYGERLANKIAPKIHNRIKDSDKLQAGAHMLETLSRSPATLFQHLRTTNSKMLEDLEGDDTPGNMLRRLVHSGAGGVLGLTGIDPIGGRVVDDSITNHKQAAIFDRNVHRSITETIPMYLARILQSGSTLLNIHKRVFSGTKEDEAEELLYNYGTRSLSNLSDYRKDVEQKVLASSGKQSRLDRVSKDFLKGAGKDLDTKENRAKFGSLIKKMHGDSVENVDLRTMLTDDRLSKYTKDDEGLKDLIYKIVSRSSESKLNEFSSGYSEVSSDYPYRGSVEFVKGVSTAILSEPPNVMSNKAGGLFTKALARFMSLPNKEGTGGFGRYPNLEDFVNGNFLTMVDSRDKSELHEHLIILAKELNVILKKDTSSELNLALKLLGIANEEARTSESAPVETFQILRDLDSRLVQSKNIGIHQTVSGKLDGDSFTSGYTKKEGRDLLKTSGVELDEIRMNRLKLPFMEQMSSLHKGVSAYKADLERDINNIVKGGGSLKSKTKAFFSLGRSRISEAGKHIAEATKKTLNEGIESAKKLSVDLTTDKGVEVLITSLTGVVDATMRTITSEKMGLDTRVRALEDIKDKIDNNTSVTARDIDSEIQTEKELSGRRINLLTRLHGSTKKLLDGIVNLQAEHLSKPDEERNNDELLIKVRELLSFYRQDLDSVEKEAEDI